MLSSVNAMLSIVDFETDNKGTFFNRSWMNQASSVMVWALCMMNRMEPSIIANGVIDRCCICSKAVR